MVGVKGIISSLALAAIRIPGSKMRVDMGLRQIKPMQDAKDGYDVLQDARWEVGPSRLRIYDLRFTIYAFVAFLGLATLNPGRSCHAFSVVGRRCCAACSEC